MNDYTAPHLRPKALAERWGMTEGALANWRSAGIGPDYIKINGSRVMYPLDAVLRYEAAATVKAAA